MRCVLLSPLWNNIRLESHIANTSSSEQYSWTGTSKSVVCRVRRFTYMSAVPIFRWKNFDVRYRYRCWLPWIFVQCMCVFGLFPIDVTATKRCDMMCLVCKTFYHRNNDHITTFSHWWPISCQGLAACAPDVIIMWTVGCAAYWMHATEWLTYRHTDTTNFLMFSLAPILPMFDVRCANRPNSSGRQWLKVRRSTPLIFPERRSIICIFSRIEIRFG